MPADPFTLAADRLRARLTAGTRWRQSARPEQIPPPDPWRVWYIRGGRGGGKTWTGANSLAELIRKHPIDERAQPTQWGIVAPTFADARDTCMEGPSGLLRALDLPITFRGWNRSQGQLRLDGGQIVYLGTADDGAVRIQGKNLAGCWCDEVGMWQQWRLAWDESIGMAVRVTPARIIATGTPKRSMPARALVRRLLDDVTVRVSTLRTVDNAANLDPTWLADRLRLVGTTFGRQELDGELLDDVDGALWTPDLIERWRVGADGAPDKVPFRTRTAVAVDPSFLGDKPLAERRARAGDLTDEHRNLGDETGIMVGARGVDGRGYLLEDVSLRGTELEWAKTAIDAYDRWEADTLLVEANMAFGTIVRIFRQIRPTLRLKPVKASVGKQIRAEPVAMLAAQGLISHACPAPLLEDQLTSWTPEQSWSPDRLDAYVHLWTELLLDSGGPARVDRPAGARVPTGAGVAAAAGQGNPHRRPGRGQDARPMILPGGG